MRVAFLLYGMPQNGGTKVLFRVGNLLHRCGHEVCFYIAEPESPLPYPSQCRLVFATQKYRTAIGRIPWLATVPIDADVAIATSHHTAYSLTWNRSLIARRLYYVQAYEPDFYSDSVGHLFTRWPMMLAAGGSYLLPLEKVVNCDGSRRGLSWRDRMRAPECPPGIDLSLYRPRSKSGGDVVIGHISRREPWKGSNCFFRAMVRLRELGHRFRVVVAYDLWPETHRLEYEAVHPNNEAELAGYYAGLNILVSTVTQKGFGYPPLEAMACGAVCVSTPIDFGRPGNDHVPILAHSAESIVSEVAKLFAIKDRDGYVAEGLKTAASYDWEILAERWCGLISGRGLQPA